MRFVLALLIAGALLTGRAARAGDESDALTSEEQARLAKTKLLIAGRSYRQSFEPYIASRLPTFVTSDSVLNAYHVLLEECVVRMERARSAELPALLRAMWEGLPEAAQRFDVPARTLSPAVLRAQVAIGTALRLVGGETPGASAEAAAAIAAEVARVVRAEGRLMPPWLAVPSPGYEFLDYDRFRPRGFYVRDERLAAYFRATAFLQYVRLRIGDDSELLTAIVLDESLRASGGRPAVYQRFVGTWSAFLGRRGDLPLPDHLGARPAGATPWTADAVAEARRELASRWHGRNDEAGSFGPPTRGEREFPDEDVLHGVEPSLRVLPATTLPDARLFDLCCPPSTKPLYPSGLYIAAALGGSFARNEALRDVETGRAARLGRALDRGAEMLRAEASPTLGDADESTPRDIYSLYLRTLAALVDAPEPGTPPLFGGDAWQAKSTNTALAGWAEMRHTWALQARESADWGSAESTCAGLVEPDPVFFGRLADCAGATWELLEAAGAFDEKLDRRELLWLLRDYAALLRAGGGARTRRSLEAESAKLRLVDQGEWAVASLGGPQARWSYEQTMPEANVTAALRVLDEAIDGLASDSPLPEKLARCVWVTYRPFRQTWIQLERLCRRLEAMAQKQLRGAAWDDDERRLLLDYGHVLARAMLYQGNSYLSPPDDAPRATSVYAWLGGEPPGYLHAAIARPRALHVLYPWQGADVHCVGTVLPYREFVTEKRLTDDEWRTLLDSKDAPPEPAWLVPITSPVPVSSGAK